MRLRIKFSKSGALRYTGHLDLQTIWERTVRRAGLPLAYTHGFHPGPRIQIASALPLGFMGRAEIVDIWLQENAGAAPLSSRYGEKFQHLIGKLQESAPPGLTIVSLEQVDQAGPALQTRVVSAEYEVTLLDPVDESNLARQIKAVLEVSSLPRERRGKTYNLRPMIDELSLLPSPPGRSRSIPKRSGGRAGVRVYMHLAAREAATARPEEVLDVLGIPFETTRIERTRLILKRDME